jgi:hypothetical protein
MTGVAINEEDRAVTLEDFEASLSEERREKRSAVKAFADPAQIAEAQRMAREWKPTK